MSVLVEMFSIRMKARGRMFKIATKRFPDFILKTTEPTIGRRNSCEIWFKKDKFHYVVEFFARNRSECGSEGYVYGFELDMHKGRYKFGKAKSWDKRRKQYRGHNSVGRVLFACAVTDRHKAEKYVLEFVGQIMFPEKFGKEWFRSEMCFELNEKILTGFVRNSLIPKFG